MNSEIISPKLFIYSIVLSVLILLIQFFSTFGTENKVMVCDSEEKLTIALRMNYKNILINPIHNKQTVECIGRIFSFYNKTIDVLVTDDKNSTELLEKYYRINKKITANKLKIDNKLISIHKNHITLEGQDSTIHIFQRPILSLLDNPFFMQDNIRLIRTESISNLDLQIRQYTTNDTIIHDGEILRMSL